MKYLSLLFILGLVSIAVDDAIAQSIGPAELNAAGGSQVINGNTYEYAIGGSIAGKSSVTGSLIVTPGVLQPVTNQPDHIVTPGINADLLQIYPNPTDLVLFLQPNFGTSGMLQYTLHDALGRIMAYKEIRLTQGNERQEIGMTNYAAGQYTLNVIWIQQNQQFQSAYKIQKIK